MYRRSDRNRPSQWRVVSKPLGSFGTIVATCVVFGNAATPASAAGTVLPSRVVTTPALLPDFRITLTYPDAWQTLDQPMGNHGPSANPGLQSIMVDRPVFSGSDDTLNAVAIANPQVTNPALGSNTRKVEGQQVAGAVRLNDPPGQAGSRPVSYILTTGAEPNPDNDPDKLLALYQDGAGQAQTSMDELDLVLGGRQVFRDLRTLETRLNDMKRPTANVVNRHSSQSDHLDINELAVSQDLFFSEGRDTVRVAVFKTDYSLPNALGINQYTGGFTSNIRLNDISSIAGDLWLNRIDYGRQRNTFATYDVYLTLRPTDTIRINIDANRRTFDNITSLRLGITARTYSGSVDFMPTDELRLTARFYDGFYSDHNRRRTEEAEAIWRVKNNPVVEIGLRGTNFHFSRLLNNGYFNPKDYYSGEAMARVQADLSQKLTVELAGSGGAEDAQPGGVKPLLKASLQLVYKLTNGWSIDGEAAHFTSRNSTSSGFSRTSFTAGLHYRF